MESCPELPEDLRELLESGRLDDLIFLDREGNWFHNGQPFLNKNIIDFFNKSIGVTADGIHVIHYGGYVYPVQVEDAPVFVTGVTIEGFGEFEKAVLNLSTGASEELDPSTLSVGENNALYCTVSGGRLTAKFRRSPSFHVLERLDETDGEFYLVICGKRIHLKRK